VLDRVVQLPVGRAGAGMQLVDGVAQAVAAVLFAVVVAGGAAELPWTA